jgi:hypothetical protein
MFPSYGASQPRLDLDNRGPPSSPTPTPLSSSMGKTPLVESNFAAMPLQMSLAETISESLGDLAPQYGCWSTSVARRWWPSIAGIGARSFYYLIGPQTSHFELLLPLVYRLHAASKVLSYVDNLLFLFLFNYNIIMESIIYIITANRHSQNGKGKCVSPHSQIKCSRNKNYLWGTKINVRVMKCLLGTDNVFTEH